MAWDNEEIAEFMSLIADLWPTTKLSPTSERAREWVRVAQRTTPGVAGEALRRLYREQETPRAPTPSQLGKALGEAGRGLPGGGQSSSVDRATQIALDCRDLAYPPTYHTRGQDWEIHGATLLGVQGGLTVALPWGMLSDWERQGMSDVVGKEKIKLEASKHGIEVHA